MNARALRRLAVAALAVHAVAGLPSLASAAVVAYIDGGEVWVSTLDGSKKHRVSGGEGDWKDVAAADNGRIAGVRNAVSNSNFSNFQVWEPNGTLAHFGALSATSGWSSYTYPLSFDISSDGLFLVYGFSNTRFTSMFEFDRGFYARSVNNASLDPFRIPLQEWPTFFGRNVVATNGDILGVQTDAAAPFGDAFDGWLDFRAIPDAALHRTDVAANGTLIAFELVSPAIGPTVEKVGVLSVGGIRNTTLPGPVDCFIPSVGRAVNPSISQDASRIAWKDDEGVKVAPAPTTAADPCEFSSNPVVISPTGSFPSIGGGDISTFFPPPPPPPAPQPQPTPPSPPPSRITVPTIPKLLVPGLSSPAGTSLTVSVPATGKVLCTATVPAARLGKKGKPVVVAACAAVNATKAGAVTLKLKFNAAGRKAKKKLKGAKLTIGITQGTKTITKVVTIK